MISNKHPQPAKSFYLKLILSISILVLIGSGCTPVPQGPTAPPGTEPSQAEDQGDPDSSVLPSDTPPLDTSTPTPSPTASPSPTLTFTPAPYALVSGNTNCRTGPGNVYDLLHTYLAGDQVQLEGKDEDGFFWYTSHQEGMAPDCWLWGQYATPVGDTSLLPVFTPPPTPTPAADYQLSYHRADVQAGTWWFSFKVENTGSITWESAIICIFDPISGEWAGRSQNWFYRYYVPGEMVASNIPPGEDGYIETGRISDPYADPEGGKIQVYVVVCESDDLGGLCLGKTMTIDA